MCLGYASVFPDDVGGLKRSLHLARFSQYPKVFLLLCFNFCRCMLESTVKRIWLHKLVIQYIFLSCHFVFYLCDRLEFRSKECLRSMGQKPQHFCIVEGKRQISNLHLPLINPNILECSFNLIRNFLCKLLGFTLTLFSCALFKILVHAV